MKLMLDKVKFYLPVFIALILSIVIFKLLFKKYTSKSKKSLEGFEEEITSMTIINELRTLLMNNESEYQNRMNEVLEKIVALEVQMRNEKMQQNEETPTDLTAETSIEQPTTQPPTTQPTTQPPTTQPSTTQPPTTQPPTMQPPTTTSPTVESTQTPKPPPNPPIKTQLNDDDSDVESNVSDDDDDINEPFVDGITSCATANCYMI